MYRPSFQNGSPCQQTRIVFILPHCEPTENYEIGKKHCNFETLGLKETELNESDLPASMKITVHAVSGQLLVE